VDIYNASSNSWTNASLSAPRYELAATSVGSLAFFAGGYNTATGASSVVDIYNASSNSWTNTSLSQARYYLVAASAGSLALFAGGATNSSSFSSVVDVWDNSKTPVPTPSASPVPVPYALVAAQYNLTVPVVAISSQSGDCPRH
jgi:hypothetical protein